MLLYDLTSTYFESDAAFVWLTDRGIPTEEVLAEMRSSDPPIYYLVGPARTTQSHVAGKTAAAH